MMSFPSLTMALVSRKLVCLHSLKNIRTIKRWVAPTLHELYRRRERAGPEPLYHRSTFAEWNYKAEIYAFSKRLNENISEDTLRRAFTHRSYVTQEQKKQLELGIAQDEMALELPDNSDLTKDGEILMSKYTLRYLRAAYPYLPEEGIVAVHDYLMDDELISHVASNIGISDLILCADFPPEKSTLAKTFKAVIGAILHDESHDRAELFVQDLVLTQLVGKQVAQIWEPFNPMGVLVKILERENRAAPESRLIREGGKNTILAVYVVGIYSDKQFLGMGPGETTDVAEEMAARDSLNRLFRIAPVNPLLKFGAKGHQLKLTSDDPNLSIGEWTSKKAADRARSRADSVEIKRDVARL